MTDTAHLSSTTGLDVDPTGQYVIANSHALSSQSGSTYPPFSTLTGTVSVIQLDPAAIGVNITSSSEPPNPTTQTSASFSFTTTDAVSTVQCELDSAPLSQCTTPSSQSYTGFHQGSHTFTIVTTDAAGKTKSASYTWTVTGGCPPPTVTITSPPNGASYARGRAVCPSYRCTAAAATTLSSCGGTTPNGARISTTTVGTHSFTVTARQSDGPSTTVTHAYRVVACSARAAGAAAEARSGVEPVSVRYFGQSHGLLRL